MDFVDINLEKIADQLNVLNQNMEKITKSLSEMNQHLLSIDLYMGDRRR